MLSGKTALRSYLSSRAPDCTWMAFKSLFALGESKMEDCIFLCNAMRQKEGTAHQRPSLLMCSILHAAVTAGIDNTVQHLKLC